MIRYVEGDEIGTCVALPLLSKWGMAFGFLRSYFMANISILHW